MSDDKENALRGRIEIAAFDVLQEKGYRKASMLQIAKRAKASNETLYARYGNKQELFSAIIAQNAASLREALETADIEDGSADETLTQIGRMLLDFMATEKAVIINRAAVADMGDTGLLAAAIEQSARQVIAPRIIGLLQRLGDRGVFVFPYGPGEAAQTYLSLLLGPVQMNQALGFEGPLTDEGIHRRAQRTTDQFSQLYDQKPLD